MGSFGGFSPPPNPFAGAAQAVSVLQAFDSLRQSRDRRREKAERDSFAEGITQLRQMAEAGDQSAAATLRQYDPAGQQALEQGQVNLERSRQQLESERRESELAGYGIARQRALIASNFLGDITTDGEIDLEKFKRVEPAMREAGIIDESFPVDPTAEQLSGLKEQVETINEATKDPVVYKAMSNYGKLLQDAVERGAIDQKKSNSLLNDYLRAEIEGKKKGSATTVTTKLIQTPAISEAQKERGQFKSALRDLERIQSQAPDFKDTVGVVNVALNKMRGWAEQLSLLPEGEKEKFRKSVRLGRDIESVRDAVRKATTGAQAAEKELMLLISRFNQSQSETEFATSLDALIQRTNDMIDQRTQTIAELRAEGRQLIEGDEESENLIGARMQENLKSALDDKMREEFFRLRESGVSVKDAQIRTRQKFRDQIKAYHDQ